MTGTLTFTEGSEEPRGQGHPAERSAVHSGHGEMDCPCGQDGSERDKRKGSLEDGVRTSESPSKQENGSQVCVRGGDRYRGGGAEMTPQVRLYFRDTVMNPRSRKQDCFPYGYDEIKDVLEQEKQDQRSQGDRTLGFCSGALRTPGETKSFWLI